MTTRRSRYYGYRFPPEIISHAVWLYHRFCLSFRDVEDLLAERCIIVVSKIVDGIRSLLQSGAPTWSAVGDGAEFASRDVRLHFGESDLDREYHCAASNK